jgi:hypothetical protein
MTQFASAAAFFRAANGQRVIKTVEGVVTVESWPAHVAAIIAKLEAQGATEGRDYTLDSDGLKLADGRYVRAPRFRDREVGKLAVRSADYTFLADGAKDPVYGDKKGATIENGALVKRYPSGLVVRFQLA